MDSENESDGSSSRTKLDADGDDALSTTDSAGGDALSETSAADDVALSETGSAGDVALSETGAAGNVALSGSSAEAVVKSEEEILHEAVNKVKDGRMHREILKYLSQHPSGSTQSAITSNVKGLKYLLLDTGKRLGKNYLSPQIFLPHLEGVVIKTVPSSKRKLFFAEENYRELENDSQSSAPQVKCCGTTYTTDGSSFTADGEAAAKILVVLKERHANKEWPKKTAQLKSAVQWSALHMPQSVIQWLEEGNGPNTSDKSKWTNVTRRLINHYKRMGCVSGKSKALEWDMDAINNVVAIMDTRSSFSVDDRSDHSMFEHESTPPLKEDAVSDREESGVSRLPACTVAQNDNNVVLVDTPEKLVDVVVQFPFNPQMEPTCDRFVAIDCEGVPDDIYLIQVSTSSTTYLFDTVKIRKDVVVQSLASLLADSNITKTFHDLHKDAFAFSQIGGVSNFKSTLDSQLALESLMGELTVGFNDMLKYLGQQQHPLKNGMKKEFDGSQNPYAIRPLSKRHLDYAVMDVKLLFEAKDSLLDALGDKLASIQAASDLRATLAAESEGKRLIAFDMGEGYSISSYELMKSLRPEDMLSGAPLDVSDDSEVLLQLLPDDLRSNINDKTDRLSDIVLDKGRDPLAWIDGKRVHLGTNSRLVSDHDINGIVSKLGGFGGDNRAGLERQLHRISAIRNRSQNIIGLTMRVGRHISGNATIISDLLFRDTAKSILFLGEPGSGKTTVVREVTKQLADRFNVCIVDTSNEIAGDGDVPHPCVGYARRMMVPSLDKQSGVMIECVQNHTPEVMVIDEIGRTSEVEAARTCKQRGVRLVASAHGDLRKLVKNPKLRGLVGGVETVTLGDAQAKAESRRNGNATGGLQKLKAQRAGPPAFDIIVELRRGAQHEWRIILDVGGAVDTILEGRQFKAQRRTRDPSTGLLSLDYEMA